MTDVLVGDLWVNPRGRRYRFLRMDRPDHAEAWDVDVGDRCGVVVSRVTPDNGWALAHRPEGWAELALLLANGSRAHATTRDAADLLIFHVVPKVKTEEGFRVVAATLGWGDDQTDDLIDIWNGDDSESRTERIMGMVSA